MAKNPSDSIVKLPSILFGVPDLDALLRAKIPGDDSLTKVVSIEGPVGCGKSTLALHAAAYFGANFDSGDPGLVLYISTDWRYAEAQHVWEVFKLAEPARPALFSSHRTDVNNFKPVGRRPLALKLQEPGTNEASGEEKRLSKWIAGLHQTPPPVDEWGKSLYFLDLSIQEVGDEWSLVEHILTLLPHPKGKPHLVVIDSIPGLETLSGGVDSFGAKVKMDTHVNRMMHLLKGKAHLLFTCTPGHNDATATREEAQADIIYRLDFATFHNRRMRTLRVVKARGFQHPLDEHPFEIRSGEGTFSSDQPDIDNWNQAQEDSPQPSGATNSLGYLLCVPSVQSLLAAIKEHVPFVSDDLKKRSLALPKKSLSGFGVRFLDTLLEQAPEKREIKPSPEKSKTTTEKDGSVPEECPADVALGDRFGVPSGTLTCLTGDPETHKSLLGMAFARQQFVHFLRRLFACLGHKQLEKDHKRPSDERLYDILCQLKQDVFRAAAGKEIDLRLTLKASDPEFKQCLKLDFTAPHKVAKISKLLGSAQQDSLGRLDEEIKNHLAKLPGSDARKRRIRKILVNAAALADSTFARRQSILIVTHYLEFKEMAGAFASILIKDQLRYDIKELSQLLFKSDEAPFTQALSCCLESALTWSITNNLHYRRLIAADVNPPAFFNIVRRYVEASARELKLCDITSDNQEDKEEKWAWLNHIKTPERLRLVVDDLKACREVATSPEAYADLSSLLTTYLRVRRVTSLLIETSGVDATTRSIGAASPTGRPEQHTNIKTWRVQFESGVRVAIALEPAFRDDLHGVVRELRVVKKNLSDKQEYSVPLVDPNFELYTSLPGGTPVLVPLEVKLYRETPAWETYIKEEGRFLEEILRSRSSALAAQSISITSVPPEEYGVLKNLCTLPYSVNPPLTLVMQVDGYWAMRRQGDLRNLHEYLTRELPDGSSLEDELEDQFLSFTAQPSAAAENPVKTREIRNRLSYFNWGQRQCYASRIRPDYSRQDRIPFSWDFGFLLVDADAINRYANHLVSDPCQIERESKDKTVAKFSVRDIFEGLGFCFHEQPAKPFTRGRADGRSKKPARVGWALFFAACVDIAAFESKRLGEKVAPFALATQAPKILDVFVLEVWLSEILDFLDSPTNPDKQRKKKREELLQWIACGSYLDPRTVPPETRPPFREGIVDLMGGKKMPRWETFKKFVDVRSKIVEPRKKIDEKEAWAEYRESILEAHQNLQSETGYTLQLYKTWLLLIEALNLSMAEGQAHPPGDSQPAIRSIACRHWYKTACAATEQAAAARSESNLVPLRLPGWFTTRGDWHLGIAKSSRSVRLGELALDLLTSVHGNRRRMELGLGLPVREIVPLQPVGPLEFKFKDIKDKYQFARDFDNLPSQLKRVIKRKRWKQKLGLAEGPDELMRLLVRSLNSFIKRDPQGRALKRLLPKGHLKALSEEVKDRVGKGDNDQRLRRRLLEDLFPRSLFRAHQSALEALPTALHIRREWGVDRLSLRGLMKLRGKNAYQLKKNAFGFEAVQEDTSIELYWLWRSGLEGYDNQSGTFGRWLHNLCEWTRNHWFENKENWNEGGGFPGYRDIHTQQFKIVPKWDSFIEFARKCDQLVAELNRQASGD